QTCALPISAVIRNDIFALGDAGQILRGKLITKVRQRPMFWHRLLPGENAAKVTLCALASHLVELSQTVMHYLGAVFPGDPVSQPNQPALNARQSAGSPEPSREALHEGHRRVASIA